MCQWSLLFLLYCNRLWLILPLGVFNLWKLHRKQTFTILTAYIIGPWRDILVPRASIPNADQKDRSSGNEMVTREISTCWACALVAWCIAALGFCPPLGQFIRVQRKWLQSFAPSNPPPADVVYPHYSACLAVAVSCDGPWWSENIILLNQKCFTYCMFCFHGMTVWRCRYTGTGWKLIFRKAICLPNYLLICLFLRCVKISLILKKGRKNKKSASVPLINGIAL